MRSIPAAALAKLATDLGTEPVIVLEVNWGGGTPAGYYADKRISNRVVGKILELSGLDEAIQVSGGGQSQQLSVVLDDTDGAIKEIFDTNDVHKKPVKVWQWFEGLDFATEKFLLFKGQINSPVIWNERERTFSFAILNRIEDVEVGFSAEEGEFLHLPDELIGKPWPLVFGTCVNVPALRAVPAISGALAGGVGIKDFTIPGRIQLAEAITCPQTPIGFKCQSSTAGITYTAECNIAYEEDVACLQSKCVELERLRLQLSEQSSYEYATITVFGGKKFPQGRKITLNINGGLFIGRFTGTPQAPTELFRIDWRRHPKDDGSGNVIVDPVEEEILSSCPSSSEDAGDSDTVSTVFGDVWSGIRSSRLSWEAYRTAKSADFFWAGGGSTVTMHTANQIIYIANILPSTILRVAAWRTLNGNRFLLTVPSELFTIRQVDYDGYQVMEIVFERPLSAEQQDTGGGWTDDIYVSLRSTVGPNTVEILRWFIETYTGYSIDSTTFDAVEAQVEKYPMNFPLLERKDLLTVLQEIATKARCALWQKNDTFYIKYLSISPTPVASMVADDMLENTLKIHLTPTEDLVTKYTQKWRFDHAAPKDNTLILRHNQKLYGSQDRTEDYYQFNILDLVRKSATYWLIRWANTWKRMTFSTSLEWLNLEAFDAVTFTVPEVSTVPFIGIVEKAVLNSAERQIDFEVWTPVRAGTMEPYSFAWPAAISENALFPTIEQRNAGLAGSGTEPNFSTVAPPGHPLRTEQTGVFQGAAMRCNGDPQISSLPGAECRQDHGDNKPSDTGDVKPEVDVAADATGGISGRTSPISNGAGYNITSLYQDLKNKVNDGISQGAKAREQAQRGVDKSGADNPQNLEGDSYRDWLNDLPDPDDLDPDKHPCQVRVIVSGFKLEEQGTAQICVPASPIFTETFVFSGCIAAQAFKESLVGQENCSDTKPCSQCITVKITGCGCEPPEGEEGALIGYRNSLGEDSHSFVAQ